MSLISCNDQKKSKNMEEEKSFDQGSFGYDIKFLSSKDQDLIVLKNKESQVIVSPKYQAKVFTSSASGSTGRSFGWINYKAFDGEEDPHMNAYGGENRLWLGPEGSKFSLFFKPDSKMVFENWKTPPAIDTESWQVLSKDSSMVKMQKEMSLINYSNTPLDIRINRSVAILSKEDIEKMLNVTLGDIQNVGFKTDNSITNIGENEWTKESGAPSLWILDMFTPSEETKIVIPYKEEAEGKVATTDYFGEIPEDRVQFKNGHLFFKADGKSRGKLGIPPQRAKTTAGSYDPINNVLTITLFEVDSNSTYLNQEWTIEKDPLKGDAVNAYNDGPLEVGSQMGPFYEIESVSPAAFLKPGASLSHQHSVFHFMGSETHLNKVSEKVLGVKLEDFKNALSNKENLNK